LFRRRRKNPRWLPLSLPPALAQQSLQLRQLRPPMQRFLRRSPSIPSRKRRFYLDHGRDVQAEEILKEAMQKNPQREDLQLKLLEVYAARNDKSSFNSLATGYHALTGGAGDNWARAAAMGYSVDPDNALYGAGKDTVVDIAGASTGPGPDLDFEIGDSDLGSTTDIELDAGVLGDMDKTQVVNSGEVMSTHAQSDAGGTDANDPITMFNIEVPESKETARAAPAAKPVAEESGGLDFNIELPSLDTPAEPKKEAPVAPAAAADGGLDLKLISVTWI
jgi:pilus assembly protein FimV